MQNKNILELCLAPGLGGLEMFVASCYEEFSKRTNCRVVVSPHSKLDDYLEDIDKFHLKRNKFFPIFPALQLAKYIDENKIDIVHFHWTRDMITAVLAKVLSKRRPKLVQSRHMGMTRFKDDFYHKWLYKNIDMIHAVTLKVKEEIEKFIPNDIRPNIEMIYLGTKIPHVDEKKILELQKKYDLNDTFTVGIVGRIEEAKGQYKVIESISKLKDFIVKGIIVGSFMDENYAKALKAKIKELGIEDKIIFTGFTKDINEHMKLFDVNILATKNETFGLVVIEAMINKVPVIATNKGGPLEIIEDSVDGLLFDGSSDDLACKIKMFYEDNNLQEQLAKAGFEKVKNKFDVNRQLSKLFTTLNES